ncbi:MAG: 3'-5' exonuclease [Deltaproteobacteria bacterium]|nr:3'-5' exonuclease [Deltaproteobacteria bacterium]
MTAPRTPPLALRSLGALLAARGPVVVLDTETGGIDPHAHSLLTVGLVSLDGARRLEIWVREPQLLTAPESMAVNGIDLAEVEARGLPPAAACDALEAFLSEERARAGGRAPLLAGHNISFDLSFLRRLYRLAGRSAEGAFSHRSLDTHTLMWALAALGALPPEACGSDGAFRHYGVEPPPALRHTALGDAVATRALLWGALEHLSGLMLDGRGAPGDLGDGGEP